MQKIRVAGIVAEYNPFHKGHAFMVEQLRAAGCGTVVVVMSGAFVQRAEPAIFPPHLRARAAVEAGADLVLRLPLPWAVASAERFAEGGTGLLAALGCVDTIAFGAETPRVEHLEAVAMLLDSEEFRTELKTRLGEGVSFAAARAAAAAVFDRKAAQLLSTPNNILGIEYCKALRGPVFEQFAHAFITKNEGGDEAEAFVNALRKAKAGGNAVGYILGDTPEAQPVYPRPMAILRRGAAHDASAAVQGYASASLLRKTLRDGYGTETLRPYVPAGAMPAYQWAQQTGEIMDYGRWEFAALARLRGVSAQQLAARSAAGEGLETRLADAAKQATTLQELYESAKTKRFAHSRVRRLALQQILDLPRELPTIPPFAHVLAANQRGLALMRRINKHAVIPVSTSLAKLRRMDGEAARFIATEAAAEDLYDLCLTKPRPGGASFTQPAAIVK